MNEPRLVQSVIAPDADEYCAVVAYRGLYFAANGKTAESAYDAAHAHALTHWRCVDTGTFYLGMTVNQWTLPDGSFESDVVVAIRKTKRGQVPTLERRRWGGVIG